MFGATLLLAVTLATPGGEEKQLTKDEAREAYKARAEAQRNRYISEVDRVAKQSAQRLVFARRGKIDPALRGRPSGDGIALGGRSKTDPRTGEKIPIPGTDYRFGSPEQKAAALARYEESAEKWKSRVERLKKKEIYPALALPIAKPKVGDAGIAASTVLVVTKSEQGVVVILSDQPLPAIHILPEGDIVDPLRGSGLSARCLIREDPVPNALAGQRVELPGLWWIAGKEMQSDDQVLILERLDGIEIE